MFEQFSLVFLSFRSSFGVVVVIVVFVVVAVIVLVTLPPFGSQKKEQSVLGAGG